MIKKFGVIFCQAQTLYRSVYIIESILKNKEDSVTDYDWFALFKTYLI